MDTAAWTSDEDRRALLLLCTPLALDASDAEPRPLSARQWSQLVAKLMDSEWERPGELLGVDAEGLQLGLDIRPRSAELIAALLGRFDALPAALERLEETGLWALTLADGGYPPRVRERLDDTAPPVLFGAGPPALLAGDVVGLLLPADPTPVELSFATSVAVRCAGAGQALVTAGAEGQVALAAALGAGGLAGAVYGGGLARAVHDPALAEPVHAGQLALLSAAAPDGPVASGRDLLLYALAGPAVIPRVGAKGSDAWEAATEALRADWGPLYVRGGEDAPAANHELIGRGARPLALDGIGAALRGATPVPVRPLPSAEASSGVAPGLPPDTAVDAFELLWPHLAATLAEGCDAGALARRHGILPAQVDAFLRRALNEGRISKLPPAPPRAARKKNGLPPVEQARLF